MVVERTTDKQRGGITGKGFLPGQSGNPAGRPPGSISVIGLIKKKFAENPDYFEQWVSEYLEDKHNRKAIAESIDGKPHQSVDVTTKGQAINSLADLPTSELERITTEGTG